MIPREEYVSIIIEPESLFVAEREGPLEEGEIKRAARWAEKIYQKIENGRGVQQNDAVVS